MIDDKDAAPFDYTRAVGDLAERNAPLVDWTNQEPAPQPLPCDGQPDDCRAVFVAGWGDADPDYMNAAYIAFEQGWLARERTLPERESSAVAPLPWEELVRRLEAEKDEHMADGWNGAVDHCVSIACNWLAEQRKATE